MILSLGNLFRYNLKTREQTVTLDRELKIVNDYMYLQKMRFGSRIKYRLSLETDAADVIIPSLSLQPLVENAVVHGLSKKKREVSSISGSGKGPYADPFSGRYRPWYESGAVRRSCCSNERTPHGKDWDRAWKYL